MYLKFCIRNVNLSPSNADNCWDTITTSPSFESTNLTFPTTGSLYPGANVNNPVTFMFTGLRRAGLFRHKFFGVGQFRQALKQPFACRPKQTKAILYPPRKDIALVVLNSPATSYKILFCDIIRSIIRHCPLTKLPRPTLPHPYPLIHNCCYWQLYCQ